MQRVKHWGLILALAGLVAAAGCGQGERDALADEDFADVESGWPRLSDAEAVNDYMGGEYVIQVNASRLMVWAIHPQRFDEVRLQVTARTHAGPVDNLFGVVCGYRDDTNFYWLGLSADGYTAIGKVQDGEETIISGDYVFSAAIAQGLVTQRVQAECSGDMLRLWLGDTLLVEAEDSDLGPGQVGLMARSFGESGVDVRFDDMRVESP